MCFYHLINWFSHCLFCSLSIPRVIPCSDFAGDVVAVGQEVTSVNIGDRVTAGRLPYYLDGTLTSDGFMKYGSGLTMDGVLTEYKVLPAEVRGKSARIS